MEPKLPPITLEWIEEQEAFHQKKLASLATLKAAYLDATGSSAPAAPSKPLNQGAAFTKKRAIFTILSGGAIIPTSEIIQRLINMGFPDTTQQNTSPQLSLYKVQGFLLIHPTGWSITAKGREYLAEAEKN